jgi:hypothetical protein
MNSSIRESLGTMHPGADATLRIFWGGAGWPVIRTAKSFRVSTLGTGDSAVPSGTEIHGV